MDAQQIRAAFDQAKAATYTRVAQTSGCGRAYVCLGGDTLDRKTVKEIVKVCKELGFLFDPKGFYGTGRYSLYVGYDNADGHALGRAEAICQVLRASGFPGAYTDAVAD